MIGYIIAAILALIGIGLFIYAKATDSMENYDALFWGIVGLALLAAGILIAIGVAIVRVFQ